MYLYDMEKYNNAIEYYCNAVGEIVVPETENNPYGIGEIEDLPLPLQKAYEKYFGEGYGVYCYCVKLNGKYGLTFVNEYYEYTEDGEPGEIYNYEYAVEKATEIEKRFPFCEVFVAKEVGFPITTIDGTDDNATELHAFIEVDQLSDYRIKMLTDYMYEHGYE